jgi:hypothetical protein
MNDMGMPTGSDGPETDDSQNPTTASPDASTGSGDGSRMSPNMQNMLVQLQQMIDQVAVRSGPVLRDIAAKAAELAAVAGEHAGPIAYKAAETTQKVGQRVAEKSKEFAADLRNREAAATESMPAGMHAGEPSDEADAMADDVAPETGQGL